MFNKNIPLFKTVFVKQDFDTLAGSELALGMLCFNPLFPASELGKLPFLFQFFYYFMHVFLS